MKQYQVISGACPVPHQKEILAFGDKRPEDYFEIGQAEQLVKDGFIKEIAAVPAKATVNPNAK